MKLFSKKRLKVKKEGSGITYSWISFNMAELFMLFFVPMCTMWGISSYNGAKEIFGLKVLAMSNKATLIYWSVIGVCILHFIFNRRVCLKISKNELVYKRRWIFGVSRHTPMSEVASTKIKRLLNLAESPDNGMDTDSYNLKIFLKSKRRIVIRGLSQDDCETIQAKIKEFRKRVL